MAIFGRKWEGTPCTKYINIQVSLLLKKKNCFMAHSSLTFEFMKHLIKVNFCKIEPKMGGLYINSNLLITVGF